MALRTRFGLKKWAARLISLIVVAAFFINIYYENNRTHHNKVAPSTSGVYTNINPGTSKSGNVRQTPNSAGAKKNVPSDTSPDPVDNEPLPTLPNKNSFSAGDNDELKTAAENFVTAWGTGKGRENYPDIWNPLYEGQLGPFLTSVQFISVGIQNASDPNHATVTVDFEGNYYTGSIQPLEKKIAFEKKGGVWTPLNIPS